MLWVNPTCILSQNHFLHHTLLQSIIQPHWDYIKHDILSIAITVNHASKDNIFTYYGHFNTDFNLSNTTNNWIGIAAKKLRVLYYDHKQTIVLGITPIYIDNEPHYCSIRSNFNKDQSKDYYHSPKNVFCSLDSF